MGIRSRVWFHWLTMAKSSVLWEPTQKISLRWYLTPFKLATFNATLPDTCWWCNANSGDLLHIFWEYSHIQNYWATIFHILTDITKCHIPPTLALAILSLTIESIPPYLRLVVTYILLVAKLSLMRLWESSQAPLIENTLDLVNLNYSYELMMTSSKGMMAKTLKYWYPWTQWNRILLFL